MYNFEQNIVDKLTKLSQTGFSKEVLQRIFRSFLAQLSNVPFRWPAGHWPSIPSISGIFLKFSNFLKS